MEHSIVGDWCISHIIRNSTDSGVTPCILNVVTHSYIIIPNNKLEVFGYVCNGPSLGITGTHREDNIEEQIECCLAIISDYITRLEKEPDWSTIRKFLRNYKGKTILDKIVPMSKIDQQSIERTINIVDHEYQSIRISKKVQ